MSVDFNCRICNKIKTVARYRLEKNGAKYCSYACMGLSKKGVSSYTRTPEQNARMSAIKKAEDNTAKRERFLEINAAKKGKTVEELYGAKAEEFRNFRKAQTGSRNPNWKGGVRRNKYPYVFYKLRIAVLERDCWRCLNCNMTQEEAKAKDSLRRGLTVHHVDYNKENNSLENLATTCKWCNSKANSRREQWQIHYRALLGY